MFWFLLMVQLVLGLVFVDGSIGPCLVLVDGSIGSCPGFCWWFNWFLLMVQLVLVLVLVDGSSGFLLMVLLVLADGSIGPCSGSCWWFFWLLLMVQLFLFLVLADDSFLLLRLVLQHVEYVLTHLILFVRDIQCWKWSFPLLLRQMYSRNTPIFLVTFKGTVSRDFYHFFA